MAHNRNGEHPVPKESATAGDQRGRPVGARRVGLHLVVPKRLQTETMGEESNGDAGQPAPMKFSFSKTKPSNRRPPLPPRDKTTVNKDAVEYVTSLDREHGIISKNPRAVANARIVPKLENSWRPEKRMKNIMVEADITKATEETFEMDSMAAGPKPDVQYGLTLMTRMEVTTEGGEAMEGSVAPPARPMSFKEVEDQKLREDLLTLPEEATLEKYDELPVEEFGEALLRGMGWEKGKPIGRNSKTVIAPIEYVRRQGRLGLGAVPAPPKETEKKYIKPGETREKKPDLVAPASADGRSRNVVDPDAKLVERVRRGVAKGMVMSIISGQHAEEGRRREREGSGGRRELSRDEGEEYGRRREGGSSSRRREKSSRKREDDEMEVDEDTERKRSRKKEDRRGERHDGRQDDGYEKRRDYVERDHQVGYQNGRDNAEESPSPVQKTVSTRTSREVVMTTSSRSVEARIETTNSRVSESGRRVKGEEEGPSSQSWLGSHIRVRFVSKSFMGGRLYLKKGRVIDVIRPKICDVILDESSEILQEVRQEYLETALPKRGGRVIVVAGKHRGQIGKLRERDSENEVGVVQLEDSFEMIRFSLEELAELVGD